MNTQEHHIRLLNEQIAKLRELNEALTEYAANKDTELAYYHRLVIQLGSLLFERDEDGTFTGKPAWLAESLNHLDTVRITEQAVS